RPVPSRLCLISPSRPTGCAIARPAAEGSAFSSSNLGSQSRMLPVRKGTCTMALSKSNSLRIGVDLGGTKIEFIALQRDGAELHRHRIATPRHDYEGTVRSITEGVKEMEKQLGRAATVGVGIPGTVSTRTGLVKNANSTWLNGKPFDKDLSRALEREVRCANDANCLAVSEATDGAGAGKHVVFAVILGTGTGGGIAI